MNEPELLIALKSRYQRNILNTYFGQVLIHINPLRGHLSEERDEETNDILEKYALDVLKHTSVTPELWDKARLHIENSNSGGMNMSITGMYQFNRRVACWF